MDNLCSDLKLAIIELLADGNFSGADNLYAERCVSWWPRSEYEHMRRATEESFLMAQSKERYPVQVKVLGLLRNGNVTAADQLYEEHCNTWWPKREYETARKTAETALLEARRQRQRSTVLDLLRRNDISAADDLYEENCKDWWASSEYQSERAAAKAQVLEKERSGLKATVLSQLQEGKLIDADRIYEERCRDWWVVAEYRRSRIVAETNLLERTRRDLKGGVLERLKGGDSDGADAVYKDHCSEWWAFADYNEIRIRAIAVHSATEQYATNSLRAIDSLLSDGHLELTRDEIARLKLPKLDVRLARYGLELDEEQRLACARSDPNLLITARAGSGKTRTLAAIAALAIDDECIDPDQVLILAFNTKAAEEIRKRVKETTGIESYRNARTFHSLAWHLAGATGRKLIFDNGRGEVSALEQSRFVERTIRNILNPAFKEALYNFFRKELEQIDRIGSDLPEAEYFVFRRSMSQVSLGGDAVKSNGEKIIADFLFEHGVTYAYERPWKWEKLAGSSAPYHPDFSISVGGKDVILEHWAIDPDDPEAEVPDWWKDTDTGTYREQIVEKQQFWSERGIMLLESHTGMLRSGRESFEATLRAILSGAGISCEKLEHGELVRRVAEAPRTISRMAKRFLSFIQRAKKRGWSVEETEAAIARAPDPEPRNRVFHQLALRAYGEYERLLLQADPPAMDFDDLMALATEQVRKDGAKATINLDRSVGIAVKDLRWLLLDEFQDFSDLYYQLIHAMMAVNPQLRVVAVGDDWQAINGFAGAQLRFFQDFARFFPEGGTASIATNYRSAAAIVGAGNRVMADRGRSAIASQRGRAEIAVRPIDKCFVEFRAGADHERSRTRDAAYFVGTPFASCEPQSKGPSIPQQQVARALKLCAEFIVASTWRESGRLRLGKLLILARTSYAYGLELSEFDKRLRRLLEHHDELAELSNEIELEVITAHKAKGNEADSVIVLDVTSRKFPLVHADNVLYHPFGVTMEDTLAEERRLFYVAITRAEWRLLLLTETGQESPYLVELQLGQGLDALECLAARDGSARASTQSLSELGVGIHSRIEELDRWDLVVGNASASAVPILERLRAQKYPPPQVGHFIQRESRKIFAEFAWPDELPPMAILTGPHAAYANDWRDLGWQIVLDQPRR